MRRIWDFTKFFCCNKIWGILIKIEVISGENGNKINQQELK